MTATKLDLRLMQTTDLHAHILAYDYLLDRPADKMGLSRLAGLIRAARSEACNTLLFDTGDFLQGTALGDLYASSRPMQDAQPHPVIAVMNSLGYDAGTLGNHDFNYGLEFLTRALSSAQFDMVCANVAARLGVTPCADTPFIAPWTMLHRHMRDRCGNWHDLRIGVVGLLPPQIDTWDRHHLEGRLHTRDMVDAARAHLPAIRAAGADLIVVLSHSGIAADEGRHRMENAALPLAALPGVDAVLCGHQHQVFPGPAFDGIAGVDAKAGTLHGKPAIMAGFWGSHLGLIDLTLQRDDHGWHVCHHTSHLRPVCPVAHSADITATPTGDDADVLDLMQGAHARTLAHLRRPVGHSSKPVHSFFALVADDPSLQLVAEAQRDRVAALLKHRPEAQLPLLSAVSPFKAGGTAGPEHFTDVPAGPLRMGNLADLYHYPNTLCAVQITGGALVDWLEHAAGQFNRIEPGQQDQMLHDPGFPCYNFDVICGLRYVIDPTKPARFSPDGQLLNPNARRVRDIFYKNQPVLPDQRFIVATNCYRASGGGGFAESVPMQAVPLPETTRINDVLADYISNRPLITPVTRPVWRFAPAPGTSALFDSAPAAAAAIKGLTGVRIETVGPASGGFIRFRLYL